MADIFYSEDVINLLRNKSVVFIGDSNVKALYKDLVWLLNNNTLINHNSLRQKLECSFLGDKLEKSSAITRSRDFYENRSYRGFNISLKFYFVTRCYCDIIIKFLNAVRDGSYPYPDVIIMNSCLWDLTRWGPNGVDDYKANMFKLMELLRDSLPKRTLFIWATALPASHKNIRGGLIVKQLSLMGKSLRFHIMEANLFCKSIVNSFGFDVIDFHFHLHFQISRRTCDGVHFLPLPVRLQTNLYLTHIALTWGRNLPRRGDLMLIEDEKVLAEGKTAAAYKEECLYSSSIDTGKMYPSDKVRAPYNAIPQSAIFPSSSQAPSSFQKTNHTGSSGLSSNRLHLNEAAVEDAGCKVRDYPQPIMIPKLQQTLSQASNHNIEGQIQQVPSPIQTNSVNPPKKRRSRKSKARRRLQRKRRYAFPNKPKSPIRHLNNMSQITRRNKRRSGPDAFIRMLMK